MKIGIDIRNIGKNRTGDETVFFNLVKNLSQIDQNNQYFLFTDRNPKTDQNLKNALDKLHLAQNFQAIPLGERGVNKFVWNFFTLPRYIQKNHLDIYHTQYVTPFFIPEETKVITTIHDVSFKVFPELITWQDRFLLNIFIPLSLKRAHKILGVSEFTVKEILKFYAVPSFKLDFVYNAVGEEILQNKPDNETKESIRKKYALPERFILYLGTLQPRKNLPLLIKTFSTLSREEKDLKLVLAGGKGHNYDTSIDDMIQTESMQEKVVFPGFIAEQDKAAILSLAEVFCLPSLYEGFGIPILEAMALNVPVLASNIEPHQEITDGAALLFNPQNEQDLQKKLTAIVRDKSLRENLRQKSLAQIEKFSWKKSAEKLLQIYQETVKLN